jgi:poly-beta-1,6-N-acetyl-D-glucosamine N-deacetylase
MKLPRLSDRPCLRPTLALLNLPLLMLAPSLLGVFNASTQWILPFSAGLEMPPRLHLPSQLNVAWKPLCRQGQPMGLEATTSAALGPHDIQFASPEAASAWQAQLAAAPFPQIHKRARLAHVPVLAYHIVAAKQGPLDVTPAELATQLQRIQQKGLTPIQLSQLVEHLRTGIPLPLKSIVLTFEMAGGDLVQPIQALLKQYKFPAAVAIDPAQIQVAPALPMSAASGDGEADDRQISVRAASQLENRDAAQTNGDHRDPSASALTWTQVKALAADPWVTIASTGFGQPSDRKATEDPQSLPPMLTAAKHTLELQLGQSVPYFFAPMIADRSIDSASVQQAIQQAGYQAAGVGAVESAGSGLQFSQDSATLLTLLRLGPANLEAALDQADGGPPLTLGGAGLNFQAPVQITRRTTGGVPLMLAAGGKPVTIHAKTRDQVAAIVADSPAVAAVDGTFFSLESLDSNQMVGPVLSRDENQFSPGNPGENPLLQGRPLVLISDQTIKLVPYDAKRHITRVSLMAELPGLTDAFVGAGWLVRDGKPQDVQSFGRLYSVNEERDRAFWGIDWADRPVVGVSGGPVGAVKLGEALSQAGLRDVVMLDSGASASLVYQKESMMSYTPRPVPHVVALYPPASTACSVNPDKTALNP